MHYLKVEGAGDVFPNGRRRQDAFPNGWRQRIIPVFSCLRQEVLQKSTSDR